MSPRRRLVLLAVLVVSVLLVIPAAGPDTSTSLTPEATVSVVDDSDETLGTVAVEIADTPSERYTGLSDTESLGPSEGMLFVFEEEAERSFVMRDMAFPIDIVFVDANQTITAIHHAPVEDDDDLTHYSGQAKWVLEVPANWTTEHDVEVGDRIRIDHRNGTVAPSESAAS
ncbi:MAG: DUF192 domain-containing protein [archaeon]